MGLVGYPGFILALERVRVPCSLFSTLLSCWKPPQPVQMADWPQRPHCSMSCFIASLHTVMRPHLVCMHSSPPLTTDPGNVPSTNPTPAKSPYALLCTQRSMHVSLVKDSSHHLVNFSNVRPSLLTMTLNKATMESHLSTFPVSSRVPGTQWVLPKHQAWE